MMMHCMVMTTAIPHPGGISYVFNFLDGFPGRCFFLSIYLLLAFKCISSDKYPSGILLLLNFNLLVKYERVKVM